MYVDFRGICFQKMNFFRWILESINNFAKWYFELHVDFKGRVICELKGCHCIGSCQFHLMSKLAVVRGIIIKRVIYRERLPCHLRGNSFGRSSRNSVFSLILQVLTVYRLLQRLSVLETDSH